MSPSFEFLAVTGSTNADLLARLRAGENVREGQWLIADRQSAGRGRQGRAWLDAPGNFMGSTVVQLGASDPSPASLSFVAALALYEAVLPCLPGPGGLQLKWPNDLLLAGAKLAGILLEREGTQAVIGIGVNLAAAPLVAGRTVDSLAAHGPAPARDAFARDLAASLERELERWRSHGIAPLLRRWQAAAHPLGTPLIVQDSTEGALHGTFAGLEDDGALRLCLADGSIRAIRAGDVLLTGG